MVHGTVEADARETLDRLAARGYQLAVLTNNSVGSAEAALERFDLRAAAAPRPGARPGAVAQAEWLGCRASAYRARRRPDVRRGRLVHRRPGGSARGDRRALRRRSVPTCSTWRPAAFRSGRASRRWPNYPRSWSRGVADPCLSPHLDCYNRAAMAEFRGPGKHRQRRLGAVPADAGVHPLPRVRPARQCPTAQPDGADQLLLRARPSAPTDLACPATCFSQN